MKKSKAVNTKKALKRLDRVGELLSKVLDQYSADRSGVKELLDSARASVVRSKQKVKAAAKEKPTTAEKSSAKEKSATTSKQSQPMAAKHKTRRLKATGKKRPNTVVKSQTSPRTNGRKAGAHAPPASISPERATAQAVAVHESA